jgi:hypothetical protein
MAAAIGVASTVADKLSDLQARFDNEADSIRKAKLLEKLGDAQFAKTREAGSANDYSTVGLVLEKYRDNVRSVLEDLKKQHPDAERQSNGYRQLEVHVRRAIREVDDATLQVPDAFRPPLQLVRQDLVSMDDELLRLLFPRRVKDQPPAPSSQEPKSQEPKSQELKSEEKGI